MLVFRAPHPAPTRGAGPERRQRLRVGDRGGPPGPGGRVAGQTTTEVTTRLVSQDGQRIFIGGLIKNKEGRARIGVPYLMEIPILGWLFRREEKVYANTETIVILTAHLVDRETPLIATDKAERMRETEGHLEQQEQRMREYFGPASFDEAGAAEAAGGSGRPDPGSATPGGETAP